MNLELSENLKNELSINDLTFSLAKESDIYEIELLFLERIRWFRKNNINQWNGYLKRHDKHEFLKLINDQNYFLIKKDNAIVSCFALTDYSSFWDKNDDAYYLSKFLVKVGHKNIGSKVIDICKYLSFINNREYLRLDCLKSNKKLNQIYDNYGFKYVKDIDCGISFTLREFPIQKTTNL